MALKEEFEYVGESVSLHQTALLSAPYLLAVQYIMWLLSASATTDPCKQKQSKIEYANQNHALIWGAFAFLPFLYIPVY